MQTSSPNTVSSTKSRRQSAFQNQANFPTRKKSKKMDRNLFCDRQVLAFWLAVMQASKHATESLMRVASCIKIWFVSLLVVRSLSSHFFACGVTKLFPACPTEKSGHCNWKLVGAFPCREAGTEMRARKYAGASLATKS